MLKKVILTAVTAVSTASLVVTMVPSAQAATPPELVYSPVADYWGTNGRVADIVVRGDRVYLAGGFDYIGPQTGYGTAVNGTDGVKLPGTPIIDGTVHASAPDGAGGWYVAGAFSAVGGVTRRNAARITAAGTVAKWNQKPNAAVLALAVAGNKVVLGGNFTAIGNTAVSANRIGAVDLTAGTAVAGFSASADNTVRAIVPVGSDLYVGGDFVNVGGVPHPRLARISSTTGSIDATFTGQANGPVRALAASADGATLYAGGDFLQASDGVPQNRSRLAAWSTTDSALRPWAPTADASVQALATDSSTGVVYAGGLFTSIDGTPRARLAAISTAGALTPWTGGLSGCHTKHITDYAHTNPPCTPEVSALTVASGNLYVGGRFGSSGTTSRHDAAAFDLGSGNLTGWNPVASDRVLTLGASAGNVFVGGELTSVNGLVRKGVAALHTSSGTGDASFTANTDNEVLDLEASPDGSTLFLAGDFSTVNGLPRSSIAAVSASTGAVTKFKANANNTAFSLGHAGGALYASGQFIRVNGTPAGHVVKLDPATGAVNTAFSATTTGPPGPLRANGMVQGMVVSPDGSKVYLGGPFNAVNGTAVTGGVVAVNGTTGALLANFGAVEGCGGVGPWITHLALSPDGKRLYGGDVCPDRIYQWDAVNMTTQANPTGLIWKSWCNGGMQGALEVNGNFYYGSHGGDEGRGGLCWASPSTKTPVVQSRYAVFDATSGTLLPDSPQFSSPMGVWSFAVVPQGLLVGGDFAWAVSRRTVRQGLALFSGTP